MLWTEVARTVSHFRASKSTVAFAGKHLAEARRLGWVRDSRPRADRQGRSEAMANDWRRASGERCTNGAKGGRSVRANLVDQAEVAGEGGSGGEAIDIVGQFTGPLVDMEFLE